MAESHAEHSSTTDSPEEKEYSASIAVLNRLRTLRHRDYSDFDFMGMVETEPFSARAPSEDSAESSAVSTSNSEIPINLAAAQSSTSWKGFIDMLKKGPKRIQTIHAPLTIPRLSRRKSRSARPTMIPLIPGLKSSWKIFSLHEIQAATNNFNPDNLIGEGGYAKVYKGVMPDGQIVAIKRSTKGDIEEMASDFLSELGIILHVSHPNIAQVIGYGVEGGLHLVLQLSPHGSLESVLRGSRDQLLWSIRHKIALGAADGLRYLHEGCHRRIIHRDIKAANILLSEDFDAQISDFGLAKWLPEQWTHLVVSKIEGTFGYLPPEFFMHGIVDEKTDVYAYGVLVLELITGRLALDNTQKSLVMWAKPLFEMNKFKELLDPTLGDSYDLNEMKVMLYTAMMCVHQSSVERPQMHEVVDILNGKKDCTELESHFKKPTLKRTYSVELDDAEEYNSTKYLNDVNHLMQIAFEL